MTRFIKMLFSILLQLVFFGSTSYSQSQDKIEPLKIGDAAPDLFFSKMLNWKSTHARISDFRGKLLILDFWSTWCGNCIKEFPRLAKIQEQLGDSIVILSVGFDGFKKGSIPEFVKKRELSGDPMPLPVIHQESIDTVLQCLFPFTGLPHEVWIGPNGKLLAATGSGDVTAENIRKILKGETAQLVTKRRIYPYDNLSADFLIAKSKGRTPHIYGSVFSGWIDTLGFRLPFGQQYDSSMWRIIGINGTVQSYYLNIYEESMGRVYSYFTGAKRTIIVTTKKTFYKDFYQSAGFDPLSKLRFNNENLFCYELKLPRTFTKKQMWSYMKEDFDRYFSIKSCVTKIEQLCWVVKMLPKGQGEMNFGKIYSKMPDSLHISTLVASLNEALPLSPFILDESGYLGPIDETPLLTKDKLQYNKEMLQIDSLNIFLKKYGLVIEEARRVLPMLILQDVSS